MRKNKRFIFVDLQIELQPIKKDRRETIFFDIKEQFFVIQSYPNTAKSPKSAGKHLLTAVGVSQGECAILFLSSLARTGRMN